MTTPSPDRRRAPELQQIVQAIGSRQRFVIASHARPDGDAIGSSLAMAYALRALGKQAVGISVLENIQLHAPDETAQMTAEARVEGARIATLIAAEDAAAEGNDGDETGDDNG